MNSKRKYLVDEDDSAAHVVKRPRLASIDATAEQPLPSPSLVSTGDEEKDKLTSISVNIPAESPNKTTRVCQDTCDDNEQTQEEHQTSNLHMQLTEEDSPCSLIVNEHVEVKKEVVMDEEPDYLDTSILRSYEYWFGEDSD